MLTCQPIGVLRCPAESEFMTPLQPAPQRETGQLSWVQLAEGHNLLPALDGLDGFSRIWLVWWFHAKKGWKPKILPPRGRVGKQGVFATRSPHRPNPVGLSAVPLLKVEGLRLWIGEHDLLDGTPILDIKPYIPRFDAFPRERRGWFAEVEEQLDGPGPFMIESSPAAVRQLDWLECNGLAGFYQRVASILSWDPFPHRTRRIVRYDQGYRIGCGDWRVFYSVEQRRVRIERVESRFENPPTKKPLHTRFLAMEFNQEGPSP